MQSHRTSRLQVAGALALALLSSAAFATRCNLDPRIPFLIQDEQAPWIGFPAPVNGMMGLADRDALPITTFGQSFHAGEAGAATGAEVMLHFRAMRLAEVRLNGEVVPRSKPAADHWRDWESIAITNQIRSGTNQLDVDVRNATGPPLMALRIEGLEEPVRSGTHWSVTEKGQTRPAVVIGIERVNPNTFLMPTPLEGARANAAWLALLALLAWGGVETLRRSTRDGRDLGFLLPIGVAACWVALFIASMVEIPTHIGFDAKHHVAYVDHLLEHGSLPRADEGWSMFHPPLYYATTALLVQLQQATGLGHGLWAWKLIGFLSGLGSALLCWQIGRVLYGARSREALFAGVLGAIVPMNLTIASYVTNESLHATLAAAIMLATCWLLQMERPSRKGLLVWGLLVSLGVLTKYTAWIVSGVAGFFLLVRWLRVEKAALGTVAARVGGLVAFVGILAGWFYIRHIAQIGEPFPLNVDLPGETRQWWSPPGYYTLAFFWKFGSVLSHPFLAGYHTAWDSFYATLWGDGQLAGQVIAAARHPHWNYDLMAVSYALAIPATLLMGVGALGALLRALRSSDPGQRAAFSFLLTVTWALVGSVLFMTLRQQDYGQMKAFYALAVTAPLALFFGLGAGLADRFFERRGWQWARTSLAVWLTLFAAVVFLSFVA